MSWVDLGAVALVLWGAAKGYVCGACHMFWHVLGLCGALAGAVFLQRPFSVYLLREWQVEAVFVNWVRRSVEGTLPTGSGNTDGVRLPEVAGAVMRRIGTEPESLEVFGRVAGPSEVGRLLLSLLALLLFFFGLATLLVLMLRIRHYRVRHGDFAEWEKLLGLVFGAVYGVSLALVSCIVLDAAAMFASVRFIANDLHISYLYHTATFFIRLF